MPIIIMAIFWFKNVKYLKVWLSSGNVGVFKNELVGLLVDLYVTPDCVLSAVLVLIAFAII